MDVDNGTLPEETVTDLFRCAAHGLADVDPASTRGEHISISSRPYPLDGLPVAGFLGRRTESVHPDHAQRCHFERNHGQASGVCHR